MSIAVDLDKSRELKFDIRATRDLEAALGKPLGLVISDITNFGVNSIVTALFVGLKHEDKSLSLNLTSKLFESYVKDKKSLRILIKKISDALEETGLFRGDDDDVGEDAEGNAQPTT